jgi:PAS domain S-box-containing protein
MLRSGPSATEVADAIPHIIWTHDDQGQPTYFNKKWTEYTGSTVEATIGVGALSFLHPDDRDGVQSRFEEAQRSGEAFDVVYRLRRSDGSYRWHLGRVRPLRTEGGRVVKWIGTATDIDDSRRHDDEQVFVMKAAELLATSLDLGETVKNIAALAVPRIADWCAVDLVEGSPPTLSRVAVAHVSPEKVQLAWELWNRAPPRPDDPAGVYKVLRTGRSEVFKEITDELLIRLVPDLELLATIRRLGLRSSIAVPLKARSGVVGVLTLVSAESGRLYSAHDVAFAEDLAMRMATSVENARLYADALTARTAAEGLASEVLEQSREVEAALAKMREERDTALARVSALEQAEPASRR